MKVAIAATIFKRNLNKFRIFESSIVLIDDFSPSFTESGKFFQLGTSKSALDIGYTIIVAKGNLFIIPGIHGTLGIRGIRPEGKVAIYKLDRIDFLRRPSSLVRTTPPSPVVICLTG